jgi:hypothetical protein
MLSESRAVVSVVGTGSCLLSMRNAAFSPVVRQIAMQYVRPGLLARWQWRVAISGVIRSA